LWRRCPAWSPAEDEECSKALERAFRKRGIAFKVGKPFEKVEHTDAGVGSPSPAARRSRPSCCWSRSAAARHRQPRVRGAGPRRWTAASCSTDERLRTNLPNVYAVGDIVPGLQLAHRGFQQGIFVAEEIAGRTRRRSTRRHPAGHLLRPGDRIDGLTEAKAKEQYGADR
jgi:dihydrolipoamide dehydrogenase